MAYNGSGTFLINTAGQPVVSGTVISSTAFNALTADLATGLSTAITKDGQTTVTANIPMSTYKFTGLGVGSAATDSANLSQVQSTVTKLLNSVSGADTITATASPTLAAYAAGQMFYFVAAGDNTTSVTLNIDSLGAKAVTRDGATALAAADIKSGEVVVVVYDGTRFQVVSQLNSAGDARFANVSIASALNVGGVVTLSGGTANGVAYLNGSKALTSGTTLAFDGTNFSIGAPWTTNPLRNSQPAFYQYSSGTTLATFVGETGASLGIFRVQNAAASGQLQLGKSRGTWASPLAVQSGDPMGDLAFVGFGGTNSRILGRIVCSVDAYTSDTDISSFIDFRTSSSGSASATEKMRLTAAGNLGIGTTSPYNKLAVVGSDPVLYLVNSKTAANNNVARLTLNPSSAFDNSVYYNLGPSIDGLLESTSTNASALVFSTYTGSSLVERARITAAGNVVAGGSVALATNATDGFLYVPTCAGTPTGTPTAITGMAPIVVNTTNNKLYFYSGGAWRDAGP